MLAYEEAQRYEAELVDVVAQRDRMEGERDRARATAVALEQELAALRADQERAEELEDRVAKALYAALGGDAWYDYLDDARAVLAWNYDPERAARREQLEAADGEAAS